MRSRAMLALLLATVPAGSTATAETRPRRPGAAITRLAPGSAPRRFVAGQGAFGLEVPAGWSVAAGTPESPALELRPDGADAALLVRRMVVPAGASPRQILARALDERLRRLPAFRESERRDVVVAGAPGAVVSGTYWFQGNAQFPRTVEELVVVRGGEAFLFHFDAFAPEAGRHAPAVELVYRSFTIRPPVGWGQRGPGADAVGPGIDPDRVPF